MKAHAYAQAFSELASALRSAPPDIVAWAQEDPSLAGLRDACRADFDKLIKELMQAEVGASDSLPSDGQDVWEERASRMVRRLLRQNRAEQALDVLRQRPQRLPKSQLYSLEAKAYQSLGRCDEALEVARAGVDALSEAGAVEMALELLLRMAVIEESRDNLGSAGSLAEEARTLAARSSNNILKLRAAITSLRVHRSRYPDAHDARAPRRLEARTMLTQEVMDALSSHPELLQEVAAELGKEDPLLLSIAIQMLGIETATDEQARIFGEGLSILIEGSSIAEGGGGRLAEGADIFARSENEPAVVRDWVTTQMTDEDTTLIVATLAESAAHADALRGFRDYFRAGVERRLRDPQGPDDAYSAG